MCYEIVGAIVAGMTAAASTRVPAPAPAPAPERPRAAVSWRLRFAALSVSRSARRSPWRARALTQARPRT
ncbi:hypothetical protein [Streptomyces sp. NPDC012510]|uniref:hypothetical protein n=1 Tax=Streptomyces sp. NPDC012510 TaxID=3364838 RepID=UPI0036EF8F79